MAQFWVPGPVELHAGVGAGGALAFVGWADVGGFHVRIVPAWSDMRADVKGNAVDVQRMGEEAFITGELKIWNEPVLRACQSRGNPFAGVPGVMTAAEMGMPMILGGATYRLLLYSPNVAQPIFAGLSQFNFVAGFLAGPDDIPKALKEQRVRVNFRCMQLRNPADGSWTLYNGDTAGKPVAA